MGSIKEDLASGQFHNIYLLCGKETYMRKKMRDKLVGAIVSEGDTMNYTYIDGKEFSVPKMIDLAETLPFFADHRLIVIEDCGLFKKGSEELKDYLENVCETTILLFVEEEADAKTGTYKAVSKNGLICKYEKMDADALRNWGAKILYNSGLKIRPSDMDYLLSRVGTDMQILSVELEKLCCYCLGKESVEKADIDEVCIRQAEDVVFDMIEAMANGQQKRAMELYRHMVMKREAPAKIIMLVGRQFRQMHAAVKMTKKGAQRSDVAKLLKVPDFVVGKLIRQAKGYSIPELKQAMEDIAQMEYAVKTGQMQETLGMELLIIQYSMGRNSKAGA